MMFMFGSFTHKIMRPMRSQQPRVRLRPRHSHLLLAAIVCVFFFVNFSFVRRVLHSTETAPGKTLSGAIIGQPVGFAHALLRGGPRHEQRLATNETTTVVVVGGGVAGLTAAWMLRKRRVPFVLLELEDEVGGNARWGEDGPGGAKYPWGAQ